MNDATQTILAFAGAIVGVVVFLTLFFKIIRHFDLKKAPNTERVKLRGVMDENTRVTVHLSNGNVFENVVLVGFTQADNIKQAFPYELSGMSILEHPDGSKTVIQSKLIRMIEVPKSDPA
ncbi:MAG: hypothetical protein P1U82_24325 [Verrucomicrobiales bacterium]|nr:hypothetical protein [Verrucomicrobiales bacterium]